MPNYLVQYTVYPEYTSDPEEWSLQSVVVTAKTPRLAEKAALDGFYSWKPNRTPVFVWKTEELPVAHKAFSVMDKYGSFAVVSSRNAKSARVEAAKDLGISPQSILSVQEVTRMARRKNPSSAMNAGRRKHPGPLRKHHMKPLESYVPPPDYLMSVPSVELVEMGTPEARAELTRRDRDPDTGNKKGWKGKDGSEPKTTLAERVAKRNGWHW